MLHRPLFPQSIELFPSRSEFTSLPSPGMSCGVSLCLLQFSPTFKAQFIGCFFKEIFLHSLVVEGKVQMFNRIFISLWGLAPTHWSSLMSFHWFLGCAMLFHPAKPLCELCPLHGRLWLHPLTFPKPRPSECSLLHTLPVFVLLFSNCPYVYKARLYAA